jgi:bleomycin hydrolase
MKTLRTVSVVALIVMTILPGLITIGQEAGIKEEKEGYKFTNLIQLPTTPVENQYKSSTCWSFSSASFMETELLRLNKGEYDLSEMFVVYNAYVLKAGGYVRWQGNVNFASGGAFHDLTETWQTAGMVPEQAYPGLVIGEEKHIHNEMDAVLSGYMEAVIKNDNHKLSPVWLKGLRGILDAYLGDYPEKFTYDGKEYTPRSFADMLGLNMDDYVEIGSYTHHPFYEQFIIELPDNWMHGEIYNVTLEEMMDVIDYSLANGYSVAWGADVSEKGFSWKNGVAIVPEDKLEDLAGTEREKWEKLTQQEKEKQLYSFDKPVQEKVITQEMRQTAFDNYETTDDHGMHIIGTAKDQNGIEYYIVKNSWGTTGNEYKGYFYASKPYVAYKTIDIMIHKDAIPKDLRKKLGL